VVAFVGGIQLVVLGVMGEYIARIHDEVKDRPLYLVSDAHGLPNSPPQA
jgi:dolichol-phosphate mannosyltransferase